MSISVIVCGKENNVPTEITIYSPVPASIMLHKYNENIAQAINQCDDGLTAKVIAVPLPDSINRISALPEQVKRHQLPIVTVVDLLPSITQTGPEWHLYSKANDDLKLIASLYDVAFGMLTIDPAIRSPVDLKGKSIGVPPRPSSLRVLSEALLRDAWNILDDIELVDIRPPEVVAALKSGRIDATTWNITYIGKGVITPLLPRLLQFPTTHWLYTDENVAEAINSANPFQIGLLHNVDGKDEAGRKMPLLSFKLGIAAWDGTEENIIKSLLRCLVDGRHELTGMPTDIDAMLDWPGLTPGILHPAALKFYQERDKEM